MSVRFAASPSARTAACPMTWAPAFSARWASAVSGAARADDIVEEQDLAALNALNVAVHEIEALFAHGCDGLVLDPDGVLHICLDGFACSNIVGGCRADVRARRQGECPWFRQS